MSSYVSKVLSPLCWSVLLLPLLVSIFQVRGATSRQGNNGNSDTISLFDSVVSELYQDKPDLAKSISDLFENLPNRDKKVASRGKKLLEETGGTVPSGDQSPIKSLVGVLFEEGEKTLSSSEAPPNCPPCPDQRRLGFNLGFNWSASLRQANVQDGENGQRWAGSLICGRGNLRCRPQPTPKLIYLPCPTCPGGCLVPYKCFTCPSTPSCKPCAPSAPNTTTTAPTTTTTTTSTTTTTTTKKPGPTPLTTSLPITTSTSTTVDPSKPTELPSDTPRNSSTSATPKRTEITRRSRRPRRHRRPTRSMSRLKRSPAIEGHNSTDDSAPLELRASDAMKFLEDGVKALLNNQKLAKKFMRVFKRLKKVKQMSESQRQEAKSIVEQFEPVEGVDGGGEQHVLLIIGHLLNEFGRSKLNCGPCTAKAPTTPPPSARWFVPFIKPIRPTKIARPTNCPACPSCPPAGSCPCKPKCPPANSCPVCPSEGGQSEAKPPEAVSTTSKPSGEGEEEANDDDDEEAKQPTPSRKPPGTTAPRRRLAHFGTTKLGFKPPPPPPPPPPAANSTKAAATNASPKGTTCGLANLNPLTARGQAAYIANGQDQSYGEWPSYARITFVSTATCGGVIVSDRHVLTAAHCVVYTENGAERVREASKYKVKLGEHNTLLPDSHEKEYLVEKICRSSKYTDSDEEAVIFDYAILTLKGPIQFNEHVQPACLPHPGVVVPNAAQSNCYVVGVGVIKFSGNGTALASPIYPNFVQKLKIESTSCWRGWRFNSDKDLSRTCYTKSQGQGDSCSGDSGGPALCLSKDRKWTVMGVVSYGTQHCDGDGVRNNWAGVYTDIPKVLKYIKSDCGI